MPPVPLLSATWEEGRYWDRWMVVHFLSGIAGGFANVFLKLAPVALWSVAVAMLIAWEFVEFAAGVREENENRAIDLVIGLAGVFAATTLARQLSAREQTALFVASTMLFATGCVLGWSAYRRRMKTAAGNARR